MLLYKYATGSWYEIIGNFVLKAILLQEKKTEEQIFPLRLNKQQNVFLIIRLVLSKKKLADLYLYNCAFPLN